MRHFSCVLFFVAARACTTFAGDEAIPQLSLFAVPKPELRSSSNAPATALNLSTSATGAAAPATTGTAASSPVLLAASVVTTELSQDARAAEQYEAANGAPLLTRHAEPEPMGGALGWLNANVWDPAFAPEEVKVGKVVLSGGVVAAVRRKNPFCLLHPLIFTASW